jgi:glycosyltransferase involved in cell wall biosynthesis
MSKKIKILYTIPNFDTAGSGKVLYDLAKYLDKNKFEVSIACRNSKGAFFKEVEALGLPIFILETTSNYRPYFTFFKRIQKIKKFIEEHHFDIVHSWHWSSDWSEIVASRLGGAKYIYTKKAMSWGNVHWKIKSYLANFIITINHDMVHFFSYKKKQQLIPLGLDVTYYDPKLFPKKKDVAIFKIITVANLVPVKGIELIIKAMSKLNNKSIYLEVLGDDRDPYAEILKNLVDDLQLQEQVQFLGKKADVRPFIANSDLYIIPTLNNSRKEGMPMALVEAMSMAVPVLGSNIAGINYVLKDFPSSLFQAGNSSDLAGKIESIVNTSVAKRNEFGNQLRTFVIEHFTIQQCIQQHEILYQSLVKID